jgi:Sensors of blue-light using FAD
MAILQLIYASQVAIHPAERSREIAAILQTARHANAINQLTGCLAYTDAWFLQLLEGDKVLVDQTYERIRRDPRHSDIRLLSTRESRGRSFPDWRMAGLDLTGISASRLAAYGLVDTSDPGRTPSSVLLLVLMRLADDARNGRT